ncbi:poly-gamma-glutamate hydrolase family protein [Streptomyces sp. SP18ES09]|uniref:poly-gamma-glutamate hydrolase family protein n=1 Tax=Streptomyces sp. SP18ES09 TaxID=3002532 RepID=UPI002E786E1D|nr:poly-gamma-glutamate hydrolase family protein [Streptomyces sp. SP18ES09]MEE1817183.1 poly-gamma-glutamate hydrolase family protein [Streptomyces sp. SP18ES09]
MTSSSRPTSRRTVLTAFAAAATAGAPLVGQLAAAAPAAAAADPGEYASNTALYKDPALVEGTSYGRRFRRHPAADSDLTAKAAYPRTAILALHGGGIEIGTSELALGIAGYDPGAVTAPALLPATYDYFLFEGLLSTGNKALHVTSRNCDDHVALSLAASHLNVLSLHGCQYDQLGMPEPGIWPPSSDPRLAVVGGLNAEFRAALVREIGAAGIPVVDAFDSRYLDRLQDFNGSHVTNPCNLTMLRKGAQIEMTTELRQSLFGDSSSRSRRAATWDASGGRFEAFRDACRRAIATIEATQPIL